MGSTVSKVTVPREKLYSYKHVTYHEKENSIIVVYGRGRTPADCVITNPVPGARTTLVGQMHSVCVLHRKAEIHNSGIVCMGQMEALLLMGGSARIEVGNNARLVIEGMLLMDNGTRLVVEPGACLTISRSLHLTNGAAVTVSAYKASVWSDTRISTTMLVDGEDDISYRSYESSCGFNRMTWCESDQKFLNELVRFFCWEQNIDCDVILPYILPHVCRRYGVLMAPRPYNVPEKSAYAVKFPSWTKK
jgi:hypothetical protein